MPEDTPTSRPTPDEVAKLERDGFNLIRDILDGRAAVRVTYKFEDDSSFGERRAGFDITLVRLTA